MGPVSELELGVALGLLDPVVVGDVSDPNAELVFAGNLGRDEVAVALFEAGAGVGESPLHRRLRDRPEPLVGARVLQRYEVQHAHDRR